MIFDKRAKTISGERILSINGAGTLGFPYAKSTDLTIYTITQNGS